VVIATNHAEFDYRDVLRHAPSIVDTRNALKGKKSPKITRL
jgi:UDP-N-acetyl-D-mannosaminuronate dehydrogenase